MFGSAPGAESQRSPTAGGGADLTRRQFEVLRAVAEHTSRHGYPPTVRELGELLGIRSTNGVNDLLKTLIRKRVLRREFATARSLVLTVRGENLLDSRKPCPLCGHPRSAP